MRERLNAIKLLIKKYGGSLKAVLEHREKIGTEYDFSSNFEEKIKDLEREINKLRFDAGEKALLINQKRREVSKEIKSGIEAALKNLGIPDSNFEVRITNNNPTVNSEKYLIAKNQKYVFDSNGIDEIEFYISTNLGEDPKPLAKVASGGEVSRIMLALKTILAKNDKLPLLIFDEIDTGVSGRIAQKVGETLKSLSEFHQIIAITHLPQIAALSKNHYAVFKAKVNDRVVSSLRKLDDNEKIEEVAKLMSGDQITESALKGAKELMGLK
jgi:DNA repair protein RecN (Recombination protein N)